MQNCVLRMLAFSQILCNQNSCRIRQHLFLQRTLTIDDIFPSRAVADHGDRESDLLLNEFHILSAVLRQFIEVADTADIALPARELFQYGLCLFQLVGNRESVAPCRRQPYLVATQSNHPIRLGRPVVAPNSPPSPPR